MFERYDERARRALFFARDEAGNLGSDKVEAHHILLGLLRESGDVVAPFLKSHDEAVAIRDEIETRRFPKRTPIDTRADRTLSHEAIRVLAYAAEEAERMNDLDIEPAHLLLGLLREKGSVAAEILRRHGVGLEAVRQATAGLLPGLPDDELEREALQAAVLALPAERRGAAWRVLAALDQGKVTVDATSPEETFTVSFDTIAPTQ